MSWLPCCSVNWDDQSFQTMMNEVTGERTTIVFWCKWSNWQLQLSEAVSLVDARTLWKISNSQTIRIVCELDIFQSVLASTRDTASLNCNCQLDHLHQNTIVVLSPVTSFIMVWNDWSSQFTLQQGNQLIYLRTVSCPPSPTLHQSLYKTNPFQIQ